MPEDRSTLAVAIGIVAAMASGGGGYALRDANDVPPPAAQQSAKILAVLERELASMQMKLDSVRRELDESNKKLSSLRDRIGDVCGPRRRR